MPQFMARLGLDRFAAIVVALFISFVSCGVLAAADGTWQGGPHVYAKVCGYCHDAGVGPVLMGRQLPPEYVIYVVRHGFQAMPAFAASFIDDKSLQDVATYVSQSPATQK